METSSRIYKIRKNSTKFFTFLVSLFVIYAIIHYYLIYEIADLFSSVNEKYLAVILLFFLFVIYPLSSILHKFYENRVVDILYATGSIWLGTLLIATFVFLCSDFFLFITDNLNLNVKHSVVGTICVIVILCLVIYAIRNAQRIYIRKVTLAIPNLPRKLWGFKIVHLSDIHVGIVYDEEFLENIVMKTNKLEPDMVAITGDLFDGTGKVKKTLVEPIKYFNAPYGVFYVTGNHENYTEQVETIKEYLRSLKVRVLENEVVNLDGLQIAGIDTPKNEFLPNKRGFLKLENKIDKKKPLVLLYHLPNSVWISQKIGVNLQLSGHTHNGQIFPFNIITKLFYPHHYGLYHYKGLFLNVSSGVGTWGPKMRLLSKNEIVQITLFPETIRRGK